MSATNRYVEKVKLNALMLKFIDNQTKAICLIAVQQNGLALKYVKEQTEDICMKAIQSNWLALQYVKEQTHALCLEAVKRHWLALQYVKNQTTEIILEAIKHNGAALKYVIPQTTKLYIEAVNVNISALIYIQDANILKNVCNTLNILYLPANKNHRDLILKFVDGAYRCWIGCQEDISVEQLIWRIYNTDGGLQENPHRQHYINFLQKHNLYTVA